MHDHELLEALRGVAFLHDINDVHLRRLIPITEVRRVPAGSTLFREGLEHPHIYLVLERSIALDVQVTGRESKRFQTVGPGELLGWSPVLGQAEMTATARVLRPSTVAEIGAAQLLAICEHDPGFGFEFMRRTARALSRRLAATRLQLLDVYRAELPAVIVLVEEE
jgi:CRP-like cAMP-binding protein